MEFIQTNYWWLLFILTVIFVFTYKKLTNNPDAITSRFKAKKIVIGNPTDNLIFIEKALKNAGFKKVGLYTNENRFYAHTKFSMSSFSEYIEVTFSPDNLSTTIIFKSICALPTQIYDWGKNKRNYKKFQRELEKVMSLSTVRNI